MQASDSPPQLPPQPPPKQPDSNAFELWQPPGFDSNNFLVCPSKDMPQLMERKCCCLSLKQEIGPCSGSNVILTFGTDVFPFTFCERHANPSVLKRFRFTCPFINGVERQLTIFQYIEEMIDHIIRLLSKKIHLGPSVAILDGTQKDNQCILHRRCPNNDISVAFIYTCELPELSLSIKDKQLHIYIECVSPDSSPNSVRLLNAIPTHNYVSQMTCRMGPYQIHPMIFRQQFSLPNDFFDTTSEDFAKYLIVLNSSDSEHIIRSNLVLILHDVHAALECFLSLLKTNENKIIDQITGMMHQHPCGHDQIVNVLIPFIQMLCRNTTDVIKVGIRLKESSKKPFFQGLIRLGILCGVFRKHGINNEISNFLIWILQMILAKLSMAKENELESIRDKILAINGIKKDSTVPEFPGIPCEFQRYFNEHFQDCYNEFKARSNIKIKERADAKGAAASTSFVRIVGGAAAASTSFTFIRVGGGAAAASTSSVRVGGGAAVYHVVSAPEPVAPPPKVIEEPVCIICMENPLTHVLIPCGHLQMCGVCAVKFQTCPTCREPISRAIHVYKN